MVNNKEEYLKNVMKPNFKPGTLLGPNLMGCEMGKVRVVMNKPVYLGQAILDLSKTIMYEFHYNYMIPKYGDRLKLCYMDMDFLIYSKKTEDFTLTSHLMLNPDSILLAIPMTDLDLFPLEKITK